MEGMSWESLFTTWETHPGNISKAIRTAYLQWLNDLSFVYRKNETEDTLSYMRELFCKEYCERLKDETKL